jgi:putative redox protein
MQSDFSPNYSIEYSNPLRTQSTHLKSRDQIITDAPTDNHGKGEAFSPTDLLSSSLVSCAMTIMGIAAGRDGIEIVSMKADVAKEMASNPRRVAKVSANIKVVLKGASEEDAERLRRVGLACPVAHSLSSELVQDININFQLN